MECFATRISDPQSLISELQVVGVRGRGQLSAQLELYVELQVVSSAADDPSVSQSVFTITEKAPTRAVVPISCLLNVVPTPV